MSKVFFFVSLGFWLVAGSAFPAPDRTSRPARLQILAGRDQVIVGGPAGGAKTVVDTINLMAGHHDPTNGPGEPHYYGDFEDADGRPDWNGWTHEDVTQITETHWSVSNVNQVDPGNLTAWCGDHIQACSPADSAWGYGADWHDLMVFRKAVGDPGASATVSVGATLRHDCEPGYDYVHLSYAVEGQVGYHDIQSWDGFGDIVAAAGQATYLPGEYLGGTDVAIYWRFKSDGGWDDGDCSYPSTGAANVDDVTVTVTQGLDVQVFTEDFQDGDPGPDWAFEFPPGVGDFAKIWTGLHDADPCAENPSPQVAFIDDGVVVPGTGGSRCTSWCYGPGGYVVNSTGGLAGPEHHLNNVVRSPVMAWPDPDHTGAIMSLEVYWPIHSTDPDSPGILATYRFGSTNSEDPADIFTIRSEFLWLRGPHYDRDDWDVTHLVAPGARFARIELVVYEYGYIWGWAGNDGVPGPYFDNVKLVTYPFYGPQMWTREYYLAQDNLPEIGEIDHLNLGSMHVRFDMAANISWPTHLRNDPGDTIVVEILASRPGADLDGLPRLHYILDANPVFDAFRSSGLPHEGSVEGGPAVGYSGHLVPGRYAFDLPDTGFLFPGDVLHYYIAATDAIGGVGGSDPQTSLLPADTTGFSTGFGDPLGYHSSFTVRALPSIRSDGLGGYEQPGILFINDYANRGGENKWYGALNNIGLAAGDDYDVYYVNSASGNGIGGRATLGTLRGYDDMLYTCGDLGYTTIANGDFADDPSDDVGVLTNWLLEPGKDMFLTGDNLVYDLVHNGGTATQTFAATRMGVSLVERDLRSFIGAEVSPLVKPEAGNPVFMNTPSWFAFGGCPRFNTFDAVFATGTAQRLAEFTDPAGNTGVYPYAAATLNTLGNGSRVISMPYDFMFIHTNPDDNGQAPLPARASVLAEVLAFFGVTGQNEPSQVPEALVFRTGHHPNPFNPVTTITYTLPRQGHLSLKVFDVRGALVRTLVDDVRPAGEGQAVWDGRDAQGAQAASGVYFYEARTAGEVQVHKMALVK